MREHHFHCPIHFFLGHSAQRGRAKDDDRAPVIRTFFKMVHS